MSRETPMVAEEASRLDEGLTRTVEENGIIRYSSGRDKKMKLSNRMARIIKQVRVFITRVYLQKSPDVSLNRAPAGTSATSTMFF